MKRNILGALASVVVFGFASSSFANEAQPELQPTPVSLSWFNRMSESSGFIPTATQAGNDYRYLTDFSPN